MLLFVLKRTFRTVFHT